MWRKGKSKTFLNRDRSPVNKKSLHTPTNCAESTARGSHQGGSQVSGISCLMARAGSCALEAVKHMRENTPNFKEIIALLDNTRIGSGVLSP